MARHRIAVIGLGMAVAPHARSLRDLSERVEVVAGFSPTAARREAFAETFGFPVTDNLDALIVDPSIGAVLILTPPNTHLDLVRRVAATGKHILLEKPLEIDIGRARSLVETAEAAGVTLGVVLQHRFSPAAEALKAILADGGLGDIMSASARIWNWRPQSYYDQPGRGTKARDGGGVLLTQGIHTLDLLLWLAGPVTTVKSFALTTPIHQMETEDLVAAAVRFDNGAIGTIAATTCAWPGFPDVIEIIATGGTAVLSGGRLTASLRDGTAIEQSGTQTHGGSADPMAFDHVNHRAVLADFLDAIETSRQPRVNGREALKVHALIDMTLRSSGK